MGGLVPKGFSWPSTIGGSQNSNPLVQADNSLPAEGPAQVKTPALAGGLNPFSGSVKPVRQPLSGFYG
jgi:hypothetical protein